MRASVFVIAKKKNCITSDITTWPFLLYDETLYDK